MADAKTEARAALARAATAVAFVAGIVSFLYGLSRNDQSRWLWILLGVGATAAASKFIWMFLTVLTDRYRNHPKILRLLVETQDKLGDIKGRLDLVTETAPSVWNSGLQEGMQRVIGSFLADDITPQAKYFDIEGGLVTLSAVLPEGEVATVGARFSLIHADTARPIAIFHVVAAGQTPSLHPTPYAHPDSWDRITERAVAGDSVPPGLILRPCSLDDYEKFPDMGPADEHDEEFQ